MKNLIQCKNYFSLSLNRLEAQMSHLINKVKDRNEETLPNTCSIIPDCAIYIDENQESWYLEDFDQDLISTQNLELDKLAGFHFHEIKVEHECNTDPQPCDSIPIFESLFTLVSLPKLDPFPEPTLILVFIDFEIEPPLWIVTFH